MATVRIQPGPDDGYDTYVYRAAATSNFSSAIHLRSGDTLHGPGVYHPHRTFLRFSVAEIPPSAPIKNVVLGLYQMRLSGNAATLRLEEVLANWVLTGITWNNQPATSPIGIETVVPTTEDWLLWTGPELVALVQKWVNGGPNYGLCIRKPADGQTVDDYKQFHSSRYSVSELRPYLDVTWSDGEKSQGHRGYNAPIIGRRGRGVLTF